MSIVPCAFCESESVRGIWWKSWRWSGIVDSTLATIINDIQVENIQNGDTTEKRSKFWIWVHDLCAGGNRVIVTGKNTGKKRKKSNFLLPSSCLSIGFPFRHSVARLSVGIFHMFWFLTRLHHSVGVCCATRPHPRPVLCCVLVIYAHLKYRPTCNELIISDSNSTRNAICCLETVSFVWRFFGGFSSVALSCERGIEFLLVLFIIFEKFSRDNCCWVKMCGCDLIPCWLWPHNKTSIFQSNPDFTFLRLVVCMQMHQLDQMMLHEAVMLEIYRQALSARYCICSIKKKTFFPRFAFLPKPSDVLAMDKSSRKSVSCATNAFFMQIQFNWRPFRNVRTNFGGRFIATNFVRKILSLFFCFAIFHFRFRLWRVVTRCGHSHSKW